MIVESINSAIRVRKSSCKRLPVDGRTSRTSTAKSANRTSIEIAPVDQIASRRTDIGNAKCGLAAQFLLNRKVVGVVHWCLEIADNLHHAERRRRLGCCVCAVDVYARRHTNKGLTEAIWLCASVENGQILRRREVYVHREIAIRHLGKESGASPAPLEEIGLRRSDRAKVRQVVIERIAGTKHCPSVAENVPGKTDSWTEVILVNPVERLLGQADEAVGISLRAIRQKIRAQLVFFSQRSRYVPTNTHFQGEIGLDLPAILHIKAGRLLENVPVGDTKGSTALVRKPQQ